MMELFKRKYKMVATDDKFNIGPYGEMFYQIFLSETSKPFDCKLCWNAHWAVFNKMCVYVSMKI
jgi:hypothetical protein